MVNREKLLAAVHYFAANTINCRLTKLLKLLYFLDFMHFEQTGNSVTGLKYKAWERGPVPAEFWREVHNDPGPDLRAVVRIIEGEINGRPSKKFANIGEPDTSLFTRREKQIMRKLAEEYFRKNAEDMVEATHLEHLPWHQVYEVEGRNGSEIAYPLAWDAALRDDLEKFYREQEEVFRAYEDRPT